MPFTVFGEIRVAAGAREADLSYANAKPFHVGPWPVLCRLLPFAALAVLFLRRRANRTPEALAVLIPLCVVFALVWLIGVLFGSTGQMDDVLSICLAVGVGFAALWLVTGGSLRTIWRRLGCLAVFALFSVCALMLDGMMGERSMVFLFLIGGSAILAFSCTGWMIRRRFTPGRLALWMVLISPLGGIVVTSGFMLLTVLCGGATPPLSQLALTAAAIGGIAGLIGYATVLPFLLLSCFSSFYRKRLVEAVSAKVLIEPEVNDDQTSV